MAEGALFVCALVFGGACRPQRADGRGWRVDAGAKHEIFALDTGGPVIFGGRDLMEVLRDEQEIQSAAEGLQPLTKFSLQP